MIPGIGVVLVGVVKPVCTAFWNHCLLVELAGMLGDGTIGMAEYRAAQAGLVARIDAARAQASQALGSALGNFAAALAGGTTGNVRMNP